MWLATVKQHYPWNMFYRDTRTSNDVWHWGQLVVQSTCSMSVYLFTDLYCRFCKWIQIWSSEYGAVNMNTGPVNTSLERRSMSCTWISAGSVRSTQTTSPKITLRFPHLFVSLCVLSYHVCNNYVTYIFAMRPCFSWLWQFRQLLCVAAMSSLAQLWVQDGYWEAEAT